MKVDSREVKRLLEEMADLPEEVMKDAAPFMKKKTPIRSGNAQSKTNLKNKTTVLADYAYADRLDNGWSRQAPNGFTDPTIDYIDQQVGIRVRRL